MNEYYYSNLSPIEMVLHIGKEAILFDTEDYETVNKYHWCIGTHGYATTGSGTAQMLFHRLVMGIIDHEGLIDHINRNKLDNRKCNLRVCSVAQNAYNNKAQCNSKSGYRGVVRNNHGEWCAYINSKGRSIYLGKYRTKEEAANAYDSAAAIIAGDFAHRNRPDIPLRADILQALEPIRREGRLQESEYEEILSLRQQGRTEKEIAIRVGRSIDSVRRVIQRGKYIPWRRAKTQPRICKPKEKHRHPRWLTEEQLVAIADYTQSGYASSDIAWAVGCSISAVNRYKKGETYR